MRSLSILLFCLGFGCHPSAMAAGCPAAPAPVRDIRANSYYSDAAGSVVDKALHETYERNIGPIVEFHRKVLAMADEYVAKGDRETALCAVGWLRHWASNGALLGEIVNERGYQANYIQKWTLGGLAMAQYKVRDLLTADDHKLLDPWLHAQALRALDFWKNPKHQHNNHYYWVAMAVMATSVATRDEALWDTARAMYDEGLSHIAADGSLEAEMARAGMALHYHNYALMPLSTIAELSRARGENWYTRGDGALFRLASLVADGLLDPSWFAQKTGKAQKVPEGGNLSWTVWMADMPLRNADKVKELARRGPFMNSQMGGNPEMTCKSVKPEW
ncbi:alginate lyase family protein [Uliginosibacterium sp. H3]|uniref:Alginate lyase family protein n=1 Tax=Uliginosibacterium silvisoli TaxID=3114758 RepID=A0ABU6K3X6_9RHOO|nr:alginate lyase family protein [Uliginosibacterium sp. H3]